MVLGECVHGLLQLLNVCNGCGAVSIHHQDSLPTRTQAALEQQVTVPRVPVSTVNLSSLNYFSHSKLELVSLLMIKLSPSPLDSLCSAPLLWTQYLSTQK